jgi:hypothetical protein
MGFAPKYDSLFQRLIANTAEPENERACWVWTGNTDGKGYGRLSLRLPGRSSPTGMRAHRVMEGIFRAGQRVLQADDAIDDPFAPLHEEHAMFDEMDPDEETIEHLCATPGCIHPDHWILLTRGQNTIAMHERRRAET